MWLPWAPQCQGSGALPWGSQGTICFVPPSEGLDASTKKSEHNFGQTALFVGPDQGSAGEGLWGPFPPHVIQEKPHQKISTKKPNKDSDSSHDDLSIF